MLPPVLAALFAALVLSAAPAKPTGVAKLLVGAWYQGDTQYLELREDGTGRLGVLELQWTVDVPGTIHLVFKEEGNEKDFEYAPQKKNTLLLKVDHRELELKKGKAKVMPKAVDPNDKGKDEKGKKDKKPALKKGKAASKG
jgi:hypothetical protein